MATLPCLAVSAVDGGGGGGGVGMGQGVASHCLKVAQRCFLDLPCSFPSSQTLCNIRLSSRRCLPGTEDFVHRELP